MLVGRHESGNIEFVLRGFVFIVSLTIYKERKIQPVTIKQQGLATIACVVDVSWRDWYQIFLRLNIFQLEDNAEVSAWIDA